MQVESRPTPTRRGALLNDARVRALLFQIIVAGALVAFAAYIIHNTATNLRALGIASGFGFFGATAGFDIGLRLIPYEITSTYGNAFLVGLVNTLVVSAAGIVLATIIGFVVGVLRLSSNWLLSHLAGVYVEALRNVPLLLQLLFWYVGVLQVLPSMRQSIPIFDAIFINVRGIYAPSATFGPGSWLIFAGFIVGIIAAIVLRRWARRRQEATGQQFPALRVGLALIVGLPILGAALAGFPLTWEFPELKGFNFVGGIVIQPEFVALLLALSLYTGAFIAEIVRAGIQAVSHGQTEAAYALGLRPGKALRVIVPPLTSQYLNLTKNSSLAVAIGYPELVSVFTGTVLNQTGQAVEVIFVTMLVYMTISLIISGFMNWYNRRIALVER